MKARRKKSKTSRKDYWFISGDQKLPIHLQNSIRDLNNDVYLSCVSVWKATVKYQLGKLPLPESPKIYLPKQR